MSFFFDYVLLNLKRFIFLIFFIFWAFFEIIAQTINIPPPEINIPTSPEAAMISRFGDIPIGYYTGTAIISIPIYVVKDGDLQIPITLDYHSSGIKVDDQATWVGLGWNLSVGGQIVQEVRGKSDEFDLPINFESYFYNYFRQRFDPLRGGVKDPYMFLPQYGRITAPNTCQNPSEYPIPYPPAPLPSDYYDTYCIMDKVLRGFALPEIINSTSIKATALDGNVWTFDVMETADGGIQLENTGKTYKPGSVFHCNKRYRQQDQSSESKSEFENYKFKNPPLPLL